MRKRRTNARISSVPYVKYKDLFGGVPPTNPVPGKIPKWALVERRIWISTRHSRAKGTVADLVPGWARRGLNTYQKTAVLQLQVDTLLDHCANQTPQPNRGGPYRPLALHGSLALLVFL